MTGRASDASLGTFTEYRVAYGGDVHVFRFWTLVQRHIAAAVEGGADPLLFVVSRRRVQVTEWRSLPVVIPHVPRLAETVRVLWSRDPDDGPREVDQEI